MVLAGKPLYVGSFRHNLDAKNRLTIPARWRFAGDEKGEHYLALPHPDGYVLVLPPFEVEKLYATVSAKLLSDRDAQDFLNKFFAHAIEFGPDKQGRIGLPDELLRHAGVAKEAVLVGTMTKFGIWSPDRWAQVQSRASDDGLAALMHRIGI
ncbi:MAG TPA: mraZ [Opitutaceae bacterium]|nr:mraZ [Opitutaceae bacterium]